MSALIDMSLGRKAIAYVGETPWHGPEGRIDPNSSIEEWTKAAGLDWTAELSPIYKQRGEQFVEVKDRFVLSRSDIDTDLGIFTGRYVPCQPIDILDAFRTYLLSTDQFRMETAGALKGGRVIWSLGRYHETKKILGEPHAPFVLLTTSFDGTMATLAQATMIRVVCNNTLTASIYDSSAATVRVPHNAEFKGIVVADAIAQLAKIAESFEIYERVAEALVAIKLRRDQQQKFFESLIPKPEPKKGEEKINLTRYTNTMASLNERLNKTIAEGAEAGRGWAVFNAVTDYVDNVKTARRTNNEPLSAARMHSATFGHGAQLKSKALQRLLELADTPASADLLARIRGEEGGISGGLDEAELADGDLLAA